MKIPIKKILLETFTPNIKEINEINKINGSRKSNE